MCLRWCREGGSNPHDRKGRRILSPLRLPVPPSRPETFSILFHIEGKTQLETRRRMRGPAPDAAAQAKGETLASSAPAFFRIFRDLVRKPDHPFVDR